ncbi:MarR family winged helix-turn-helix transcriptional regulator [Chromobacterium sp.]|uniref:MarR family winged helix-turn-helix transcriptional regulator n=1 Tax=Chromobacterium sp. TaxID=306190 RepID=UPI0035AEE5D4
MADLSAPDDMRAAMEAFFHAYKAFTDKPDEMLAKRGLARVHHRILFFVARYPGLSVKDLLGALGVTKQAINMPLRQLLEMDLVQSVAAHHDKRVKQLSLTTEGRRLEETLHREQLKLLQTAFDLTGKPATAGWMAVNHSLAAHTRLGAQEPQDKA